MTSDPLVDTIIASPDDDAPRLVWADREGGERGELVVIQCRLASGAGSRDERRPLVLRERELLKANERAWFDLGDLAWSPEIARGFVESAAVSVHVLADAAKTDALFTKAPLLSKVVLRDLGGGDINRFQGPTPDEVERTTLSLLERAFSSPHARAISTLIATPSITVSGDYVDVGSSYSYADAFVDLATRSPALASLRWLAIIASELAPSSLDLLVRLQQLETLALSSAFPGDAWVRLLRQIPTLRSLYVANLAGDELARLLAAPEVRRLEELVFGGGALSDDDLRAIARTPFRALRRLGVQTKGEGGVAALAGSPHLATIRELAIGYMVENGAIELLAKSTFAANLRILNLDYAKIDDRAVPALLSLPALEHLHVGQVRGLTRLEALERVIPIVRR